MGGIRLTLMSFNFVLTLFMLFTSIFAGKASGGQFLILIVSASLLAFQIFFLVWRVRRARKKHLELRKEKQKEVYYYDTQKRKR